MTNLEVSVKDLLWVTCLQTRQALTPEQINEACYVDVNANKTVFESLRKNPKVNYDGKRFSYKVVLVPEKNGAYFMYLLNFNENLSFIYLKKDDILTCVWFFDL